MRILSVIFALGLLAIAAAQTPQQQPLVFKASSNLVIVNVAVRDHSGKLVQGLKRDDFELLEDGKPQKLSVFEFQRLNAEEAEPAPAPAAAPAVAAAPAAKAAPMIKREITTSKPGEIRYRDRRLIVLFFDFSSMPPEDQIRAQKSAGKFLDEQMTPADMISIMAFSSRLQVLQDFTADREQLQSVLRSFRIGEGSELAVEGANGDDTSGEDTGAAFTPDETEFNVFNTDRKLSALETAVKMLQSLPEKKAVVYFSSGVGKTGVENQSQLLSTVNAAVRSNVSFYPVDARGLVAEAPLGSAKVGSQRGTGAFSGAAHQQRQARFNDQQETLSTLAADTGGKALLDTNDLSLGIVQAQRDIGSYYILGYYSTNAALDGRFRKIKVELASNKTAKLDYRSGYFASKEFKAFTSTDKERQLEEAILLGDPVTDLSLALEVNYFRLGRERYFVPVAVKIPGAEVTLAKKGSNQSVEFDFIGQVRDPRGRIVGTVRDGMTLKLAQDSAAQLGRRQLQYDTAFTLPPGDYTLKFLARENTSGKMGTFETKFNIPDLTAQTSYLRTSSVVWASQREPLSSAVASAEKNKKLLAAHPLVQEGQKLIPSITKVFRRNQDLYVYFEVYDPGFNPSDKEPNVTASLSFFRNKLKAFESDAVNVKQMVGKRPQTVAVEFRIPLAGLTPGRYTCQVNAVDEIGKKFAFQRSPLILLP